MPSLNTGNAILSNPIKVETTAYNVGIGAAASSSFKLQVTGTTNLTGALTGTSATFSGTSGAFIGVTINNTDATGSARLRVTSTGSNINDFSSFSASHPTRANQAWIGGDGNSTTTVLQAGGVEFLRGTSTGAATFSSSVTAGSNSTIISSDGTYGAGYGSIGFGGNSNGNNRVFGSVGTGDGLYLASATGRGIFFRPNGGTADLMTLSSGGNVGIGTSSPSAALHIDSAPAGGLMMKVKRNGVAGEFQMYQSPDVVYLDSAAASGNLAFSTVGTERMRITSGGNVLIGTTTDTGYMLRVTGYANIGGNLVVNGDATITNSLTLSNPTTYTGKYTSDAVTVTGGAAGGGGGTIIIGDSNYVGLLIVSISTQNCVGIFLISSSSQVLLVSQTTTETRFSTTAGTLNTANIYFSGSNLILENNIQATRNFRMNFIGKIA